MIVSLTGWTKPDSGEFVAASSVQLRNLMRTSEGPKVRRACYEGIRSIGPFVAERFAAIVRLRNQLARGQGYEDYYDMKVCCAAIIVFS